MDRLYIFKPFLMTCSVFLLLFTFAVGVSSAANPVITVVSIHDGDTITIRYTNGKRVKVRLLGIDAPELDQTYGTQSKRHLDNLLSRTKTVTFRKNGEDMYGRYLGTLYADGKDINMQMVKDGFAWHYSKHIKYNELAKAEADARYFNRGLWSAKEPIAPWDFRANKRQDVYDRNTPILKSPVKGVAICIDTRTGDIKYFMNSCPKHFKALIR